MENIDLKCAELGAKLGRNEADERLITASLGVLEEQGVYAFFLFLMARGKEPGNKLSTACAEFLRESQLIDSGETDVLKALTGVANDLDKLLYARDILRQSLIYARYHAKVSTEATPGHE